MLKKILFFLWSLLPFTASAQHLQYESLLDEGKVWTMKRTYNYLTPAVDYYEYKFMDETVIDGITYKKLYSTDGWNGEKPEDKWRWSGKYIGQDEHGNVFQRYERGDKIESRVAMDFSLDEGNTFVFKGDAFNGENEYHYAVWAVCDTLLNNSSDKKLRKCLHLSMKQDDGKILYEDWFSDTWIEGIGSLTYGPLGMLEAVPGSGIYTLLKCTQQNATIYENKDETTLINTMERQPEKNDKIFDLQGRQLTTLPPMQRGFYIRNGKKYVVK